MKRREFLKTLVATAIFPTLPMAVAKSAGASPIIPAYQGYYSTYGYRQTYRVRILNDDWVTTGICQVSA